MGDDNLQRMKTLDDAWNGQNWEVFRKRHSADTAVYWPGQPGPTRGRDAHQAESRRSSSRSKTSSRTTPYKVMFASGDWTRTIAKWRGKNIGPWRDLSGKVHAPTTKSFELEFCTVAHWKNGEIVEEKLYYDQVSFLRQVGLL